MILNNIKKILKKNTINILIPSLIIVMMVIGSCATGFRVSLQDHTISTSTGLKLMSDHRILDMPIEYFFISGKLANWTIDPMECAISRIDGLVSPLWRVQKLSILQQQLRIQDLGYYLRQEQMLKRCLQTRWYLYPRITHSFSNRYRTEWNVPKQNYRTRYRQEGSRGTPSKPRVPRKIPKQDWIRLSTGRTPVTIPTMGKSSNYLSTMNRVNGRGRTTSSITGGLQKRVLGSDPK